MLEDMEAMVALVLLARDDGVKSMELCEDGENEAPSKRPRLA